MSCQWPSDSDKELAYRLGRNAQDEDSTATRWCSEIVVLVRFLIYFKTVYPRQIRSTVVNFLPFVCIGAVSCLVSERCHHCTPQRVCLSEQSVHSFIVGVKRRIILVWLQKLAFRKNLVLRTQETSDH